jgi:hypothetical protein
MTTNYSEMTDNELDRLVAEKVMGWEYKENEGYPYYRGKNIGLDINDFHPSTNISQAFEVVEKMIADGWVEMAMVYKNIEKVWEVEFYKEGISFDGGDSFDKSLPRAICIAALMAKESEDKE